MYIFNVHIATLYPKQKYIQAPLHIYTCWHPTITIFFSSLARKKGMKKGRKNRKNYKYKYIHIYAHKKYIRKNAEKLRERNGACMHPGTRHSSTKYINETLYRRRPPSVLIIILCLAFHTAPLCLDIIVVLCVRVWSTLPSHQLSNMNIYIFSFFIFPLLYTYMVYRTTKKIVPIFFFSSCIHSM